MALSSFLVFVCFVLYFYSVFLCILAIRLALDLQRSTASASSVGITGKNQHDWLVLPVLNQYFGGISDMVIQ